MVKILREEPFDDVDWNDVARLAFIAGRYLYEHSDVRVSPETRQVHIQESKPSQRRRKRETK